ncbi:MmgE/PrpD family protein [Labrys sp. (in: a-proteobacteria)]|uniref:MmgE/PrpD family protein n=1 Tax=Labrys sp. (in: a-proteobacteria) TaxID=1917972 RepID=UPI0039E62814
MSEFLAENLARKIGQVRFSDFPAATVHKAKLHILDTLGAALAGSASPETRSVIHGLGLGRDTGDTPVWGIGLMLDNRTASFVNGVSAHAFELDDAGGCDHSGAVVLPAVLAALTDVQVSVDGAGFLKSILIGYEVGRRVLEASGGYEAHNGLGWHSTGTCGVFGAAAAAGVLLGLDTPQLTSALGLACSYAGGTWAFIQDGSQAKKLHAGRAAEGGLIAAKLARASLTGPAALFDAQCWGGFFSTFARHTGDTGLLVSDFGQNWRLNRCSIKPYATCRGTHSAIDAIGLVLGREGLVPEDVAAIEVRMSAFQIGMCGGKSVSTRADAQMSLPYALAARLQYGQVTLAELGETARMHPQIARWLSFIRTEADPDMSDDAEPVIAVTTGDGRRFVETVEQPLGSPANPMADEAVIAKFTGLASGVVGLDRSDAIRDFVLNLERQPAVHCLSALLRHPSPAIPMSGAKA